MVGQNFPVSDYYRDNIIDAHTISRGGNWWSALLVIRYPRSGDPFLGLYRWQKSGEEWKTRNRFLIRKRNDARTIIDCLHKLAVHLDAPSH